MRCLARLEFGKLPIVAIFKEGMYSHGIPAIPQYPIILRTFAAQALGGVFDRIRALYFVDQLIRPA